MPPTKHPEVKLPKANDQVDSLSVDEVEALNKHRQYEVDTSVERFYKSNHEHQTLDAVLARKKKYSAVTQKKMSIWDAFRALDTITDESDPDTDEPQCVHAFQTAEMIRRDNHPEWMILVGLVHDLGKVLTLWGEPQHFVVGDTFPVGCAFSDDIVYAQHFKENPDASHPIYSTKFGIYKENCGLDNLHFSYGHDEYLYHVLKKGNVQLPPQGLDMVRYHSFYAGHQKAAYQYLWCQDDHEKMRWLKTFQKYDLYSKLPEPVDVEKVTPYYKKLVAKYAGGTLNW